MRKFSLYLSLTVLLSVSSHHTSGQGKDKLDFKGYVKFLHSLNYYDLGDEWLTDNLIHNRLEIRYYPMEGLSFEVGVRNRFFYGETIKKGQQLIPGYTDLLTADVGFLDLSFNWAGGNPGDFYLINTSIDRLFVDYTAGDWQFQLGRHRINWGQNLVWNPNDVFNAYSYFDFDYEERPGTDAVRVQYYTSYTSSAELVYQLGDSIDAMSFMGLYRFNKWNYDVQFMGGFSKGDIILGTGWSGDIKGGGFRGEFTYFEPKDAIFTGQGQLVASISGDYTFRSSLYLHASYLYNSKGTKGKAGIPNPSVIFNQTSAKFLTLSRGSAFGQIGYQITPLFRGDFAAIVNPYDRSWFIAPAIAYSLSNNIELFFIGQVFSGEEGTEFGDLGQFYNVRFKWSF